MGRTQRGFLPARTHSGRGGGVIGAIRIPFEDEQQQKQQHVTRTLVLLLLLPRPCHSVEMPATPDHPQLVSKRLQSTPSLNLRGLSHGGGGLELCMYCILCRTGWRCSERLLGKEEFLQALQFGNDSTWRDN